MHPYVRLSVSMTTRPKRTSEVEGEDYYFCDEATFLQHIESDAFLEYAVIFGHYYGTQRSELVRLQDFHVLFDVDINGMRQIKENLPSAVSVFIAPPSIDALETRLLKRNEDSIPIIKQRLAHAKEDLSYRDEYDHIVLNDQLEDAIHNMAELVG